MKISVIISKKSKGEIILLPVMKRFCDKLEQDNITYSVVGDDNQGVSILEYIKELSVQLNCVVAFDSEQEYAVQIFIFNLCTIHNVSVSFMKSLNQLNSRYRWYKFFMDENNNIVLTSDAIIDVSNPHDEIMELLIRGINIAKSSYPDLMKAAWA